MRDFKVWQRQLLEEELEKLLTPHARSDAIFAKTLQSCFGRSVEECFQEKRLGGCKRSRLFLIVSALLDNAEHPALGKVALAIEMMHHWTLIVDDIQDGATSRRGKPALHVVSGQAQAINMALWMIFDAIDEIVSVSSKASTLSFLSDNVRKMVLAQFEDLEADWGRSYMTYRTIAMGKTGRMYALAAGLACELVSDLDSGIRNCFVELMHMVGVCFQLRDDLDDAASWEAGQEAFDDPVEIVRNIRQSVFSVDGRPSGDSRNDLLEHVADRLPKVDEWLEEERAQADQLLRDCHEKLRDVDLFEAGDCDLIWEEAFVPLVVTLTG